MITRSLSKPNLIANNNKEPLKNLTSQDSMNIELSTEMLEAQLSQEGFPLLFSSQPHQDASSQRSAGLDLLVLSQENNPCQDWRFSSRPVTSSQETVLDSVDPNEVSSVGLILESSIAYSPSSISSSPASPCSSVLSFTSEAPVTSHYFAEDKTSIDNILEEWFPVNEEDMLEDLAAMMDEDQPEDCLPQYDLVNNPPADSFALATSSQYQEGLVLYENPDYCSQEQTPEVVVPVVEETKPTVNLSSRTPDKKPVAARKGRKRKASDDLSSDEKKRSQNAQAAKKYRERKQKEMMDIFGEKKALEEEVAQTKKRFESKMNERNILLKMLYEAYVEEGSSMKKNIKFPDWLPEWYKRQRDN